MSALLVSAGTPLALIACWVWAWGSARLARAEEAGRERRWLDAGRDYLAVGAAVEMGLEMARTALVFAALALLAGAAGAAEPCRAVDGDTLRCGDWRIRIADIDAPEMGGCAEDGSDGAGRRRAEAARDALQGMIEGRSLRVVEVGRDRWGRSVARVSTAEDGDLGAALVARGHARSWRHEGGRPAEPRPVWCAR